MTRRSTTYSAGLRARAVRMVAAARPDHPSEASAIRAVADDLGISSAESVRRWVRSAEAGGIPESDEADVRDRRRRSAEAARAADIYAAAALLLRESERPPTPRLVAFIAQNAGRRTEGLVWGVEPICAVLSAHGAPIAPSTYYAARAARPTPSQVRDEYLTVKIAEVRAEFGGGYGARRIWAVLNERGIKVARCTVERLLRELVAVDDPAAAAARTMHTLAS